MERNNQIVRILKIVHELLTKEASVTIQFLADRFSVNPKTIRRDLKAIKESPFGLESSQINDKRIFYVRGHLQPMDQSMSKITGTDKVPNSMNTKNLWSGR